MAKLSMELEPSGLFGDKAKLVSLTGREEISRPFEFNLSIASPNDNLRPGDIIGKALAVRMDYYDDENPPEPRYIHGYISHFWAGDYSMSEGDESLPSRSYRVTIVPWIWFMARAARCFIYLPEKEEKTILDVLEELLKRVKSYEHVEPWIDHSNAQVLKSRKVEHCVQYRETDLNFLSRTLEKYGVHYYFRHEKDKHTLILSDSANYPNCEEYEVECAPSSGSDTKIGRISNWEHSYEFVSGKWSHTDYDFKQPSSNLRSVRQNMAESNYRTMPSMKSTTIRMTT